MMHIAGSGVPGFLDGPPRTAKLLARSALLADTKITRIDQPVMNALLAIAIKLFLLILHLKPPQAEWENSCPQPRLLFAFTATFTEGTMPRLTLQNCQPWCCGYARSWSNQLRSTSRGSAPKR
jgi:hypothetical protein